MDRKELLQALAKWQEQDKENRAMLCVIVERNENEGAYNSSQGMVGTRENLVVMIKNALKNDKMLALIIRKAVQELAFEATIERMFEKVNNNEKAQEEKK